MKRHARSVYLRCRHRLILPPLPPRAISQHEKYRVAPLVSSSSEIICLKQRTLHVREKGERRGNVEEEEGRKPGGTSRRGKDEGRSEQRVTSWPMTGNVCARTRGPLEISLRGIAKKRINRDVTSCLAILWLFKTESWPLAKATV